MAQELLLVNPSRRRRRAKRRSSGRRFSAKQRAWQKKFAAMYGGGRRKRKSSRRRHRNPASIVYKGTKRRVSTAAWKRSPYRRNPRSRRRYRRNPIGGIKLPTMRGVTKTVTEAFQGAVGATLVDIVMGQLSSRGWLPSFTYTQYGYPLTKGALAIGVAALAEGIVPRPLRGIAAEMAKGSITITLAGVIRGFVPDTLPLGARPMRRFAGMGYGSSGYIPSARPRRALMGEYVSGASAREERNEYYPSWDTSMGEYLSR